MCLVKAQDIKRRLINRTRGNRIFDTGQKVFVKLNKRVGNKLSQRYARRTIQADLGTTVLIRGRIVHKDNIR